MLLFRPTSTSPAWYAKWMRLRSLNSPGRPKADYKISVLSQTKLTYPKSKQPRSPSWYALGGLDQSSHLQVDRGRWGSYQVNQFTFFVICTWILTYERKKKDRLYVNNIHVFLGDLESRLVLIIFLFEDLCNTNY